ncbi:hypothetical protein ACFX15_006155 [Malus domestica]
MAPKATQNRSSYESSEGIATLSRLLNAFHRFGQACTLNFSLKKRGTLTRTYVDFSGFNYSRGQHAQGQLAHSEPVPS